MAKFEENSAVKKLWKQSHFKNLFNGRNNLLTGYPATGKGLEVSDPTLNFKGGNYTFKASDGSEKFICKSGTAEVTCNNKGGGRFDVTWKDKVSNEMSAFGKYEKRKDGVHYVSGIDYADGDLRANMKYNMNSGWFKGSATTKIDGGWTGAAEWKAHTGNGSAPKVNAGATFASALGVTGVAVNEKSVLTMNHYCDLDQDKSVCAEVAVPLDGKGQNAVWLAGGWRMNNDYHLKARMNQNADCHMCVKSTLSPNMSMSMGYLTNLQNPNMAAPQFGFKVDAKM